MSDEQRVRTMAGWIGVEISRSRVRTPGKVGYGLYRVRGQQLVRKQVSTPSTTTVSEPYWAGGRWTAYAFTLEAIESEIETAIRLGIPAAPCDLWLRPAGGGAPVGVTTRWTSAYRGKRNLGVDAWRAVPKLERDIEELERTDPSVGAASRQLDEATREIVTRSTVRSRQRAANAEFQREHLERRAYGLQARYRAKSARNAIDHNSDSTNS